LTAATGEPGLADLPVFEVLGGVWRRLPMV
jgi:hypothetical protein